MIDAEKAARDVVARNSQFRRHADEFEFELRGDVLLVRGQVPSFYLKQLLQTMLRQVDGIRSIDNRVDVVSSVGRSSV